MKERNELPTKKLSYSEQLKHPLWQKRRLEIMSAAGFQCSRCSSKDVTLNVHHVFYKKGYMLWEYKDKALRCLCEDCHAAAESHKTMLQCGMAYAEDLDARIAGYAVGAALFSDGLICERVDNHEVACGIADFWGIVDEDGELVLSARVDGILSRNILLELICRVGSTKPTINNFSRVWEHHAKI